VKIPRLELEPVEAGSEGELPAPLLDEHELELRLGERVLARERWRPEPGDKADEARERRELDAMVLACFHGLMSSAEVVVELAQLEAEIEAIRAREPGLVRQALRAVELVDLLVIVRVFVRERVPLPSTEALLRALAEGRGFHDPSQRPSWPERAREALADHWVMDVCDALERVGRTRWLRPSLDLEDALLARCELDEGRPRLHLPAADRARLVERFGAAETAAILCSSRARPAFAALVAGRRPHLPVIALPELRAAGKEPPPTTVLDLE
jgi:type III secretion protein V